MDEHTFTSSHICCLYHTDAEHSEVVSRFIHEGLVRNEKIISILDLHESTPFLNGLDFDAIDVPSTIARGQLLFYTTDETYLHKSMFHPVQMIALLTRETQAALEEGYAGLRVTSDMGWTRRRSIDLATVCRYEVVVNDFLAHNPCMGLCRYHRWSFPSTILADIVSLHSLVISQGQVYANPLHTTFADVLDAVDDDFSS